jgi:tetrahydromethanopterin S-methyltransferase subunit G
MFKSAAKRASRPVTRRFFYWTDRHIEAAVHPLYAGAGRVDAALADQGSELAALHARVDALERSVEGLTTALPQVLEALSTQNAWARLGERRLAEHDAAFEDLVVRADDVAKRVDETTKRVDETAKRVDEVRATVVGTREELDRTSAELGDAVRSAVERVGGVESRVEFVRRELAFELRYSGKGSPAAAESPVVEPRVVDPEKLAAHGADLRINVGCGHVVLEDYVNVDMRDLPGVDVVAEVHNLPFDKGSLAEVHSAHVLEHFTVEDLRRRVLPNLAALLRSGGLFSAVVPDAETMLAEYSAGRYSFEELRLVTFGEQEYEGDFHFTMFSCQELADLLREAGLDAVEFPVVGRRNGACYEMHVTARMPAGTVDVA